MLKIKGTENSQEQTIHKVETQGRGNRLEKNAAIYFNSKWRKEIEKGIEMKSGKWNWKVENQE